MPAKELSGWFGLAASFSDFHGAWRGTSILRFRSRQVETRATRMHPEKRDERLHKKRERSSNGLPVVSLTLWRRSDRRPRAHRDSCSKDSFLEEGIPSRGHLQVCPNEDCCP